MTDNLASLSAAFGKYCPQWENSDQRTVLYTQVLNFGAILSMRVQIMLIQPDRNISKIF